MKTQVIHDALVVDFFLHFYGMGLYTSKDAYAGWYDYNGFTFVAGHP
jgi:hypothetical protein